MKALLSYILLFFLLGIYLIVPFKHQFLNTLHFLSHVSLYENPYHQHNHAYGGHGHHHGFIEQISHAMNDTGSDHSVPAELTTFEFQPIFPPVHSYMPDNFPVIITKIVCCAKVFIKGSPCFKVPTPPP